MILWFCVGGTEAGAVGTAQVTAVQPWSSRGCGNLLAQQLWASHCGSETGWKSPVDVTTEKPAVLGPVAFPRLSWFLLPWDQQHCFFISRMKFIYSQSSWFIPVKVSINCTNPPRVFCHGTAHGPTSAPSGPAERSLPPAKSSTNPPWPAGLSPRFAVLGLLLCRGWGDGSRFKQDVLCLLLESGLLKLQRVPAMPWRESAEI